MHLLARQATEQGDGRRLIEPCFDLCSIDGAHSWETDGLAFTLVDLLLRPDRWIIFDDLDWTYGASPSLRSSILVAAMTEEERTTPQVRKVVELLVCSRPDYRSEGHEMPFRARAFADALLIGCGAPNTSWTDVRAVA